MANPRTSVLSRSLAAPVERAALFLVEAGHLPEHAVAMAANLLEADVPKDVRGWRHLTMTPQERDDLAGALLSRRVLVEGTLLALESSDVREGTVLSAHALCETPQARNRPVELKIGGGRASLEQIRAARARLIGEIGVLDEAVEKAIPLDAPLSVKDRTAKADPRVVHLQNRLNSLGYRVQPDGVFGPIVHENIKDLQAKAGLEPNGVVDSATRDALRHGGKPSWSEQINAPPGLVPGQDQPAPLAPAAAGERDVNKETSSSGSRPGSTTSSGDKSSARTITVKLSEAKARPSVAERLWGLLEEAKAQRKAAIDAHDARGMRVAQARFDVFARKLDERDFSQERRAELVKKGHALREDGRDVFPIEDAKDLSNAAGLWKSGHHATPAAKAHIQRQAARLGSPDPFGEVQEADGKGDWPSGQMPSACPKCGAPMRKGKGVCQRGHSMGNLAEATDRQLEKDGILQEDWKTWDAARKAGSHFKDDDVMRADDLRPGHVFYKKGIGGQVVTGVTPHPSGDSMRDSVHLHDDWSGTEATMTRGDMDPSGKSLTAIGDQPRHPPAGYEHPLKPAGGWKGGGMSSPGANPNVNSSTPADDLIANYRKMYGRDPSPADIAKLKKSVARRQPQSDSNPERGVPSGHFRDQSGRLRTKANRAMKEYGDDVRARWHS